MHPKSPKWLNDIRECCDLILEATGERSLSDYLQDRILRSAVERNFEIIGEALNRLSKTVPETAERIPEYRDIISFRNLLIHGYEMVDDSQVWEVIERDVEPLGDLVSEVLKEVH